MSTPLPIQNALLYSWIILFTLLGPRCIALDNAIKFRITNTSNGYYDEETIVRFHSDASTEFDPNFDAYKLFSSSYNVPSLYSKTSGGQFVSINAYPGLGQDYHLRIFAVAHLTASYSLSYQVLGEFDDSTRISIRNTFNDTFIPLSQLPLQLNLSGSNDTMELFQVYFSIPAKLEIHKRPCPRGNQGILNIKDIGNEMFSYQLKDQEDSIIAEDSLQSDSTQIAGLRPMFYKLEILSNTGEFDKISFQLDSISEIQISHAHQLPSCGNAKNGVISVESTGGEGPFSIHWLHDGSMNWTADSLEPMEYGAVIHDQQGCSRQFEFKLEALQPILAVALTLTGDSTYGIGEELTLVNGAMDCAQSLWEIEGDTQSGESVNVTFRQPGLHKIVLMGRNGECSAKDEITVNISSPTNTLGQLASAASPQVNLQILQSNLAIESALDGLNSKLLVIDQSGKSVIDKAFRLSHYQEFDTTHLFPGIYTVFLAFGQMNYVQKVAIY